MSDWIALGRTPAGYVGYALNKGRVQEQASGADAQEVLTALNLPDALIMRIGEGDASSVPCAVLPGAGQVLPALSQVQPADIINGWVRLWIAGYLQKHPDWDGIVCALHGDVTHWLHISAGEVVSCQSSLTQRLFAALNMALATPDDHAIADSLSRPERLATQLRAAEVGGDGACALGHLIGAELAATRAYWLGQQVVVIGEGPMAAAYGAALQGQGVPIELAAANDVLADGLAALGKVVC